MICKICNDTGKRPGSDYLDCVACHVADERRALDKFTVDYCTERRQDGDYDLHFAIHQRARKIEREVMLQLFLDPENQPTQYGTVLAARQPAPVLSQGDIHLITCQEVRKIGSPLVDKVPADCLTALGRAIAERVLAATNTN